MCAWREDDHWTGECPELGTATDGKSPDEVFTILEDLVILNLNALADCGQLEQQLEESGVTIYTDHPPEQTPLTPIPWRDHQNIRIKEHALAFAA